jgi:hypothetical protein
MNAECQVTIHVGETTGEVSGLLLAPDGARAVLVFGHGAGAGMRHPFMARVARDLAERGIATLRYQFPYMEEGRKRVDAQPIAEATVRAAIAAAARELPDVALFAGGKSYGGRMTSNALAKAHDERVRGIVFHGFPLHMPKKPARERAAHLRDVRVPMLFLQGTRDDLADLRLIGEVVGELGERATLHVVEGGDHSFAVPRGAPETTRQVFDRLVREVAGWVGGRS